MVFTTKNEQNFAVFKKDLLLKASGSRGLRRHWWCSCCRYFLIIMTKPFVLALICAFVLQQVRRSHQSNSRQQQETILSLLSNSSNETDEAYQDGVRVKLSSRFNVYDLNKNGVISLEELAKVTRTKLANAEQPFVAADLDGDKLINSEEFNKAPWLFSTGHGIFSKRRKSKLLKANGTTIENAVWKSKRKKSRKKIKQLQRKERLRKYIKRHSRFVKYNKNAY